MRAGKLDRVIHFERAFTTVAPSGATSSAWVPISFMRAERLDWAADSTDHSSGALTEIVTIFRTRMNNDVRLGDRVREGSDLFDIVGMKEIGRQRGLELRCRRVGP